MRKRLGFLSTWQQKHTVETVSEHLDEMREQFPKAGYFEMKKHLRIDHNVRVSRKVFYCAGVNDLWCVDQHDKWKYCFGLCLHSGIDPFTGILKWMRVWWNNSNPILICSYYLDVVEHTRHGPVLTQSDMGNENGNLARAHSFLHQWADKDLDNTLQHRWMAEKKNIPSEIVWSVFRAHFSFGYEGIFQFGVEQGWYDPKVPLEAYVSSL
ncbi:uncharacterized protein EV420DRAFT_1616585 [Desarmillaria tabescens]|uniref:Uncharacterized protein n=1 Tax=Armillaria tabescens TaxID=1929756 RepID=A0AA39NLG3_ARMTA|nr:uncharacterized protein EV420DRAFT_1616585 [Desarmillaria tabescens]KAK0467689.1 hypothetical protein EV420DRAFT_1616585 [Desarmillaria tabescens]